MRLVLAQWPLVTISHTSYEFADYNHRLSSRRQGYFSGVKRWIAACVEDLVERRHSGGRCAETGR